MTDTASVVSPGPSQDPVLRVFHAAVSLNPSPGVVRQMQHELVAAKRLALAWEVELIRPSDQTTARTFPGVRRLFSYLVLRMQFGVRVWMASRSGQLVLIRFSAGDPIQFLFSWVWGPYVTVHHTMEEHELGSARYREARLQLAIERLLGRSVVQRASAIVCMTNEIAQHERSRAQLPPQTPAFTYPNGILWPSVDAPVAADERSESVEIVFAAAFFYEWHGLDKLLHSTSNSNQSFTLHIIGATPHGSAAATAGDQRIVFHGLLDSAQVSQVMARAWVGLSSFALESKGMREACTLKVRDYLQAGVPVYAGHVDSALPDDFPFYLKGPADIDQIVSYARSLRHRSRQEVSAAAKPYIDKARLLAGLHDQLKAWWAGRGAH